MFSTATLLGAGNETQGSRTRVNQDARRSHHEAYPALFFALFFSAAFLHAECVNDHRSNKNAGILVADFSITGTQTISATELARITSDFIGTCFDEDSEELEERNVHGIQNCPDAVVEIRLIIDPAEDRSHAEPKNVPCEEHHDVSK
jgi:hypothetical protein